MSQKILVTGAAGFIGFHICKKLIGEKVSIIGIDNLNDYYDINLKQARLNELINLSGKNVTPNFSFIKCTLEDKDSLEEIFKKHRPKSLIHLAAQAGVRFSLDNPSIYINSNLVGFGNILECCRNYEIEHFLYASSSSVYGGNKKVPFSEKDMVDNPVSLYAATKKANELMAYSYSHLYKIPSTGIRFFTVYGPWGRPDMAPMIFTKAILSNKPIKVFNNGDMYRDLTYIDDATESVIRLINKPPKSSNNLIQVEASKDYPPHRIINVGNSKAINLLDLIETLENELNIKAIKIFEKMQPGDVKQTYADTTLLKSLIKYEPKTSIKDGIRKFVKWYRDFYRET